MLLSLKLFVYLVFTLPPASALQESLISLESSQSLSVTILDTCCIHVSYDVTIQLLWSWSLTVDHQLTQQI